MNNPGIPNPFESAKLLDVVVAQMLKEIAARPDVRAVVYDRETTMTRLATWSEYVGDEYVGERSKHTERVCLVDGRAKFEIAEDLRRHMIRVGETGADMLNNPEAPNPMEDPRLFGLLVSQTVNELLAYPGGYAVVYDRETLTLNPATRDEYQDGGYVGDRQEHMEHVCYITDDRDGVAESVRRRMRRTWRETVNEIEDYKEMVEDAEGGGWGGVAIGLGIALVLGLITGAILALTS